MTPTKLPPKTLPNPAYTEALRENEEIKDAIEELIRDQHQFMGPLVATEHPFALIDGMNREVWSALPERGNAAIPDEGAWIFVKSVPYTELAERFEVPEWSIWRARPEYQNRTFTLGKESGLSRKTKVHWPMLKAVISTPGGDLWLYPGEYSTIPPERLEVYLERIGHEVQVHFMGAGDPGDFANQLYYLMCHGIPRAQAMLLLLPNLTDSNFCYFTVEL